MNLPLPATKGSGDLNDLIEIRRYLFRLVEQLNNSLNGLAQETEAIIVQKASSGTGISVLSENAKQEYIEKSAELKSLIIKNAKIVEQEMDEMVETFHSTYVAQSDYGTFAEQIENRVKQTADGQEQSIQTISAILDNYITTTNGYIRQGIVDYEGITPIIGIAIGQDITVTGAKETVDGIEYDVIDTEHNMSIWTPERLSFYLNGNEVAYFSNNALHVSRINLGDWEVDASNGLLFRWAGGDS